MTNTWSARIDWSGAAYTDDELVAIAEHIAPLHGVVNTDSTHDRTIAQLTVDATTLRQAVDAALTRTRQAVEAVGGRFLPVRVDVLEEDIFRAELLEVKVPPLVGYAEIAEMADVSRQRARELPQLPGFPPAVAQTANGGPLRVRQHVADWIAGWDRRAGRRAATPSMQSL